MMTKMQVIDMINEACDSYSIVGIRFGDHMREEGDTFDISRANDDREDERVFPDYGTEEYENMVELDGTCAWLVGDYCGYRDDLNNLHHAVDAVVDSNYDRKHAFLVVGNRQGDTDNYVPDPGEILIRECKVYKVLF